MARPTSLGRGGQDWDTYLESVFDDLYGGPAGTPAPSATYSALRRPPLFTPEALVPTVSTDTPTQSLSGPGGASPVSGTGAEPTSVPYNTTNVTFLGGYMVHALVGGYDYMQNHCASDLGGSAGTPFAVEFDYYGQDFALWFRNNVGLSSTLWMWVDGHPVTAAPVASTANSAGSVFIQRYQWGTTKLRRIRIYMADADWAGMDIHATDTVTATAKPGFALAVLGDSYIAGTGADNVLSGMVRTMARLLDIEVYNCGFGGTGYVANNGGTGQNHYGDSQRLPNLLALPVNATLVFGSVNDSGSSSATVGAAADSLYASIVGAGQRLIVAGVQDLGATSTANNNNNTALHTSTTNAGGDFIDMIGDNWITGTGHVGATAGDGNADVFIGSDGVHPTQAGHDYLGRRLATAIANLKALAHV